MVVKVKTDKMDPVKVLEEQVRLLSKDKSMRIHDYFGRHAKIGVLSDTHVGSLYSNQALLELAYAVFKKEGIEHVYHSGDIVAGEHMYRGQEYELVSHGLDGQVRAVAERYPNHKGITTHFITGNHDLSFYNGAGCDIGEKIAQLRPDMDYIGREEQDILIKNVKIRLSHPGKGTAYALSYHPQKYIESLTGGDKPHILVIGHYHKAEALPFYRNIYAIQAGCTEAQTPFMRRRNISAMMGFWTLEFGIDSHGPNKVSSTFYPYFNRIGDGKDGQ
jgi:predicted phosphodiesterase